MVELWKDKKDYISKFSMKLRFGGNLFISLLAVILLSIALYIVFFQTGLNKANLYIIIAGILGFSAALAAMFLLPFPMVITQEEIVLNGGGFGGKRIKKENIECIEHNSQASVDSFFIVIRGDKSKIWRLYPVNIVDIEGFRAQIKKDGIEIREISAGQE